MEHIEEFSTEGLRTLLYSFKWLDKTDYETWSKEYSEAKTALTNRSKLIEKVGAKIESNLELLGATAIEDKLQDGVSEAIDKLRRAGIKLWMLTGDKEKLLSILDILVVLSKIIQLLLFFRMTKGKTR